MEFKRGDRVEITSPPGYVGQEFIVCDRAPTAMDGEIRYYVKRPGAHSQIMFRAGDMRMTEPGLTGHETP